jgi:hypothetical protein
MGRNLVSGPNVGLWIAQKITGHYIPGSTAIGLEKDGMLVAGVMFENYNGRSMVAHMAVTGRMTREYLGEIFRYAYQTANVQKLISPVSSTNEKCIRYITNLGFEKEAELKDASPDGDILLFTLEKPKCRFLGNRYG